MQMDQGSHFTVGFGKSEPYLVHVLLGHVLSSFSDAGPCNMSSLISKAIALWGILGKCVHFELFSMGSAVLGRQTL